MLILIHKSNILEIIEKPYLNLSEGVCIILKLKINVSIWESLIKINSKFKKKSI